MRKFCTLFAPVLFIALFIGGCGSDSDKKAESIMNKQVGITENYVNGLTKAQNSDEVVAAVEQYTAGMKELIPQLQEFYKNHPEYRQGKMPEGMEKDLKRLEAASAKIPEAMMKITSYMMDPKVQQAMMQMGNEMSKIQQ